MEKQEALLKAKAIVKAHNSEDFFGAKDLQSQLDEIVFEENGSEYIFRFDGQNLIQDEI